MRFFNLLSTLSVRENVALPVLLKGGVEGEALKRADLLLEEVGLSERRGALPHTLSGGEMQRTAIARALVHEPALVLADEPTGNLDSRAAEQVVTLLRRLAANHGATVVMVTHDIDEAIYLSDRIVVMTNGPEARIGEIVEVPLPRPRDKQALLSPTHPSAKIWSEVKAHLMNLLTHTYSHPVSEA